MYFSAFPEEFSVTSVIIPEELFLFPPPCCVKVRPVPEASLLGVIGVQPRAVLFHLPPDDQEHLRHVLRKLLAEKCAERDTGGGRREIKG